MAVLTLHSSKSLEFPRVIVAGTGQLDDSEEHCTAHARLLYAGMSRVQDHLLMTTSRDNQYSRELLNAASR